MLKCAYQVQRSINKIYLYATRMNRRSRYLSTLLLVSLISISHNRTSNSPFHGRANDQCCTCVITQATAVLVAIIYINSLCLRPQQTSCLSVISECNNKLAPQPEVNQLTSHFLEVSSGMQPSIFKSHSHKRQLVKCTSHSRPSGNQLQYLSLP
jgi:hypothetical protein